MKILYLSYAKLPDYQSDALFLGLRSLFGEQVVDFPKIEILYRNTFEKNRSKKDIGWGKGFTLYGLLDDIPVDRDDIGDKIKNRYFDLIIYGGSYRALPLIQKVLKHYPANQIAFVDGDDASTVNKHLVFRGTYFKRELYQSMYGVHPISFAIPPAYILSKPPTEKTRIFAICDPRDRNTYIYDNQEDYFHGYQEAFFGVTMKKAGWDALRHYEILANGCLPLFLDIEQCPIWACWNLPKFELSIIKKMAIQSQTAGVLPNLGQYLELSERLLAYTKDRLSTTALAKYLIQTIEQSKL